MASSTVTGLYSNRITNFPPEELARFVRVQVGAFNGQSVRFRDALKAADPTIFCPTYVIGTEMQDWQFVDPYVTPRLPFRNQWSYKRYDVERFDFDDGSVEWNRWYDPSSPYYPTDWDYVRTRPGDAWIVHTILNPLHDPNDPLLNLSLGIEPPGARVTDPNFPGFYQMNFGNQGWREWVYDRAAEMQAGYAATSVHFPSFNHTEGYAAIRPWYGGDCLYMDNIWVGWTKTQQNACRLLYGHREWSLAKHGNLLAEFSSEEDFRDRMIGFLAGLRARLGPDEGIWGNLYAGQRTGSSWNRYFVEGGATGGLDEAFVVDFPCCMLTPTDQDGNLQQLEWVTANGYWSLLHAQGWDWDLIPYLPHDMSVAPSAALSMDDYGVRTVPQRMRFSLAAYFLIQPTDASRNNPNLSFRYHGFNGEEWRTYPWYELDLGGALGPRYRWNTVISDPLDPWYTNGTTELELWRRDFANGYVLAHQTFQAASWWKLETGWVRIPTRGDGRIVMLASQPGQRRFGKEAAGASSGSVEADRVYVSRHTMPEAGRLIKLTAWMNGLGPGSGTLQAVRGAIYRIENGKPTTLLKESVPVALRDNQPSGWIDLEFDLGVDLPAGEYGLAVHIGRHASVARLFYDTVATTQAWRYDAPGGSWAAGAPATLGTLVNQGRQYAIYATYIAEGVPLTPSNLQAHEVGLNEIHLTWQNNATDAHGLEIQRSTDRVTWKREARFGSNTVLYPDMGLEPNVTYHYRARALGARHASSWSNVSSATTWGGQSFFRAISTAASPDNTETHTSLTLQKPEGVRPGDVMLAQITVSNATQEVGQTLTPPAGWTLARQDNALFTMAGNLYWKVAAGTEPESYTWTWANGRFATGIIAAFGNVDPANPIDTAGGAAPRGPQEPPGTASGLWELAAPSVTTTANQARLVALGAVNLDYHNLKEPVGMERRALFQQLGVFTMLAADEVWPNPSETGSRAMLTRKSDESNHQGVIHLVALRPLLTPPAAPSAGSVAQEGTSVRVSWTAHAENESGFIVERRENGGTWRNVAALYRNTNSYIDEAVRAGVIYQYRVRAFNPVGRSGYGPVSTITPLAGSTTAYEAVIIAPTPNAGEGTRFLVLGDGFQPTRSRLGTLRLDAEGAARLTRGAGVARQHELALLVRNVEPNRQFGSRLDVEGLLGLRAPLWFGEPGSTTLMPAVVQGTWSVEPVGGTEAHGEYWVARATIEVGG